jgi:hypothetical protein
METTDTTGHHVGYWSILVAIAGMREVDCPVGCFTRLKHTCAFNISCAVMHAPRMRSVYASSVIQMKSEAVRLAGSNIADMSHETRTEIGMR